MTYIVFLLTVLVAGIKFYLSSNMTTKRENYFKSLGYELKNPKFRQRWTMSGKCAAVGFFVGMLGMYWAASMMFTRIDMMVVALCIMGAVVVSKVVRHVSFASLDFGRLNGSDAVKELNEAWVKRPQPLQASDEHGSAKLEFSEGTELTDADAMRPSQEGGRR